jgi:sulfite reductase (NADPH) flavoprotein alpha-component
MTTTISAPAVRPSVRSVPVLPDSAPFTTAQRAWLNGFFAGLMGGQTFTETPSSSVVAPAAAPLEAEEEFPWHESTISLDERLKLAEDKPIERRLMAAMAQLDCGACGYLCQTYGEAIARGEEKDLTKCVPGGRETSKAIKQLMASAPAKVVPVSDVRVKKAATPQTPSTQAPSTFERNNPFPARLVESRRLNGDGSVKDTRLVVIDLRDSGITYKPGDALGVFPENCPTLVGELLEALELSGAEDVPGWNGDPISLREALTREFTITRPTPDLFDILSRRAADAQEKAALEAMRDSEEGAGDLQIVDLLRKFPSARPAAGDFVATLSPRLYSISSSLAAHPGRVHLTVGAVRYSNSAGRECGGVASTFLADRVRPGQAVRIFVHPSHKFALPQTHKPIIMVGPGTGIAPFRAFLQERAASNDPGKSWLFFGDQRSICDFLFKDELDGYLDSGVLSRLDTAFSRDQQEKVYVQNRMIEQGAELWQWLQDGAHFYVCGDAQRMAADVDKALRQVVAQHGSMDAAKADAYVAQMIRDGRYQRDVY